MSKAKILKKKKKNVVKLVTLQLSYSLKAHIIFTLLKFLLNFVD